MRALEFSSLVIARPSLLLGQRREPRLGERVGVAIGTLVTPLMLGRLRDYRPIQARHVALALVFALSNHAVGERILTHKEMESHDLAGR